MTIRRRFPRPRSVWARLRAELLRRLGCPHPDGLPRSVLEPLAPQVRQAAEEALRRDVPLRRDLHAIVQRFVDSFDPAEGTYLVEHAFRVATENEAMRMRLRQVRMILEQVPSAERHRMVEIAIRMLDVELARLPILGSPD